MQLILLSERPPGLGRLNPGRTVECVAIGPYRVIERRYLLDPRRVFWRWYVMGFSPGTDIATLVTNETAVTRQDSPFDNWRRYGIPPEPPTTNIIKPNAPVRIQLLSEKQFANALTERLSPSHEQFLKEAIHGRVEDYLRSSPYRGAMILQEDCEPISVYSYAVGVRLTVKHNAKKVLLELEIPVSTTTCPYAGEALSRAAMGPEIR